MPQLETPPISLLWPPGFDNKLDRQLSPGTITDLDLESLVSALSPDRYYAQNIRSVLLAPCHHPDVITYRQAVLADLIDQPDLVAQIDAFLPTVSTLNQFIYAGRPGQTTLDEVVWRLGQLESYVDTIQGLNAILTGKVIHAEGLRRLRDFIHQTEREITFQHLVKELPGLIEKIRSISSITIGVNLDEQLRPVEATLLAINNKKFAGPASSLLSFLLGKNAPDAEWSGIAPLHGMPRNSPFMSDEVDGSNPVMHPLFRDLAHVLKQVSRPIAHALHQYTRVNIDLLGTLQTELAFYLGAVQLTERVRQHGLPMCRPDLAPIDERCCELEDTYNLNLALRLLARDRKPDLSHVVITNDVHFGDDARIFILTGPNQGGKTTYTQAIGQAQVLAQAGLFVPGSRARISPVDTIYTHFPVEEKPNAEAGRLGEESRRLNDIFASATRHSLILLNESLSSTSFGESLYLARDIVRILQLLGARAVYATHLHELAAGVDELNAESSNGSRVISLVSLVSDGVESLKQTYRIVPGPPRGRSYAREVASRYGISYDQLEQMLRKRGLLNGQ
jgi:hypothetical protein